MKIKPLEKNIPFDNILIEVDRQGISLMAYNASGDASVIQHYFDNDIADDAIAEKIKKIFNSEALLKEKYKATTICWNFPNSSLVPVLYYKEELKNDYISLTEGGENGYIRSDFIVQHGIYNVYSIPDIIHTELTKQLPDAKNIHSTSLQLKQNYEYPLQLECIVSPHVIKILLFKDNNPLFVNYFFYNSALDASYFLLNTCIQHDLKPDDVKLVLSGSIERDSNIYNELNKFFINIQLKEPVSNFNKDKMQGNYPSLLFTHLIALAKCV